MDNVEKRLQAKVKHQITVEKQREERKYKRNSKKLENGTKKVYYTILKEVIRNKKEENVLIDFVEFMDGNDFIPFILCIWINDKQINLRKTYLNFNKLKKMLEYYGFDVECRKNEQYRIEYIENGGLHFLKEAINNQVYVTGYRTKIKCKRSIICDALLNMNPNEVIKQDIDAEETKTYTKQ